MDYRERIGGLPEAIKAAVSGQQVKMWTAMPGIINTTSLGQDGEITATVRPAIQVKVLAPDGSRSDVELPLLHDVPIVFPRGGKYALTFPITEGDECLVVFSSRCIDNWWQNGGVQPQFEMRLHDLSDGFAIPGPYSQATKIPNVSDKTAQLRTSDGTIFVELDADNQVARVVNGTDISITTDAKNKVIKAVNGGISVTADANANDVTVDGSATARVHATGSVTLDTPTVNITGNLVVKGEIQWGTAGTHASTHRHGTTGTVASATSGPTPGS